MSEPSSPSEARSWSRYKALISRGSVWTGLGKKEGDESPSSSLSSTPVSSSLTDATLHGTDGPDSDLQVLSQALFPAPWMKAQRTNPDIFTASSSAIPSPSSSQTGLLQHSLSFPNTSNLSSISPIGSSYNVRRGMSGSDIPLPSVATNSNGSPQTKLQYGDSDFLIGALKGIMTRLQMSREDDVEYEFMYESFKDELATSVLDMFDFHMKQVATESEFGEGEAELSSQAKKILFLERLCKTLENQRTFFQTGLAICETADEEVRSFSKLLKLEKSKLKKSPVDLFDSGTGTFPLTLGEPLSSDDDKLSREKIVSMVTHLEVSSPFGGSLVIQGVLAKKATQNSPWQDRLFVLDVADRKMRYFKAHGAKEACGFIDLRVLLEVHPTGYVRKKTNLYTFEIVTLSRTYFLAAKSETERIEWVSVCKLLTTVTPVKSDLKLLERFKQEDKNKHGVISFNQVANILLEMDYFMSAKDLKSRFKEADTESMGKLSFDQFTNMIAKIKMRPEVWDIFASINQGNPAPPIKFYSWLRVVQKDTAITLQGCQDMICMLQEAVDCGGQNKSLLTFEGFNIYLSATRFNRLLKKPVFDDLTHPLSCYWIASSHNTYLLDNQLTGESSLQGYIDAFQKGCRCVELDCWDGPDGVPIIFHGRTLTSKIKFEDVVHIIREHAFKVSPYPVILSIENHCSAEQQIVMANIFKKVLGGCGYLPPASILQRPVLPSPEELKFKILLKCSIKRELLEVDEEDKDVAFRHKDVVPQLASLVHLTTSKISEYQANGKPWEMLSLGEGKIDEMEELAENLVQYTNHQLLRIYPKGIRVDSSNYNPMIFWRLGAQLVALNYQTDGKEMWINDCRFRTNRQCGYVLKPAVMRAQFPKFNPMYIPMAPEKILIVQVISAWQLVPPRGTKEKSEAISPYVNVQVHGIGADCKKAGTRVIDNNGLNPVWKETFTFPLHLSEIAVVLFTVKRTPSSALVKKKKPLCHAVFLVNELEEGYKAIPLKGRNNQNTSSTLLVQISFYEPA